MLKNDWTMAEMKEIYQLPLFELISKAHLVHIAHNELGKVQVCTLVPFKEGGCLEDCKYCSQSVHYQTGVKARPITPTQKMVEKAKEAIANGATRICLWAAWREIKDGKAFDTLLAAIKEISNLGVEVCGTLGMLTKSQAEKLAEHGLYAYSHNIDTSREYYDQIITTRTFDDRIKTLDIIEEIGLTTCCGGILGLGETVDDRISMLRTLATRKKHPESVPINLLVNIKGTPLENNPELDPFDFLRIIALARIVMPKTFVRISGGRKKFSMQMQALCFFAGANSIHTGEKLINTPSPTFEDDRKLFTTLGLRP